MRPFRIALYPGDGIGPEVLDEAVRLLRHTEERVGGFSLEMTRFPWGSDYYFQHGRVAPEDFLQIQ